MGAASRTIEIIRGVAKAISVDDPELLMQALSRYQELFKEPCKHVEGEPIVAFCARRRYYKAAATLVANGYDFNAPASNGLSPLLFCLMEHVIQEAPNQETLENAMTVAVAIMRAGGDLNKEDLKMNEVSYKDGYRKAIAMIAGEDVASAGSDRIKKTRRSI